MAKVVVFQNTGSAASGNLDQTVMVGFQHHATLPHWLYEKREKWL
jgi:hypothetical protein